jgi:hypothetical protein
MSQRPSNYDPRTGVAPSTTGQSARRTPAAAPAQGGLSGFLDRNYGQNYEAYNTRFPGVTRGESQFLEAVKNPFTPVPVVGGYLNSGYKALPFENAVQAAEDLREGDYLGAAGQAATGVAQTLTLGLGGLAAKGGGFLAKALPFVGKPQTSAVGNVVGTAITGGPKAASAAPANPTVQAASAADFRRLEESQKPQKTEAELAAEEAARQAAAREAEAKANRERIARELGIAGGTLAPLTPEQIEAIASQERAAQRQYDNLLNQYLLQERQGRQGQEAAVGQARREAAGQQQDISTQLAALGMDVSPGSALSGETAVFQGQQAREAASIRNLADILAQAASGRTVARSDLEAALGAVNKERVTMQTANTQANLDRYLSMIAGQ